MVGRTAKWGLVDCQLRKSKHEHTLSDDPGNSCAPDKKKAVGDRRNFRNFWSKVAEDKNKKQIRNLYHTKGY